MDQRAAASRGWTLRPAARPRDWTSATHARSMRSLRSRKEERANVEAWSESAPYWERHAAVIRAMFEPLSDALIEDAALEPAKTALDVAAGTGEPALRIAEICGPSTMVACTDVVAEMVAAAKREAARRELRNVT